MVCKTIIGGSIPPRASNLSPFRSIFSPYCSHGTSQDRFPCHPCPTCIRIEGRAARTAPLPVFFAFGSNRNAFNTPKGPNRMKKLIFLFLALAIFAIPSRAQSVDASLSYSYFRLGGSGGLNQNGVSGSVASNLHPRVGLLRAFARFPASPCGAF